MAFGFSGYMGIYFFITTCYLIFAGNCQMRINTMPTRSAHHDPDAACNVSGANPSP